VKAVFLELRLWLWAATIRPLKHLLPLPRLVKLAVPRTRADNPQGRALLERRLAEYLPSRERFPGRPPGNCLERSLAAYRLLCAAGADPRLAVGVRPGLSGVDGHVWVVLHGAPFGEAADVGSYATVVIFDADGNRDAAGATDLSGVRWA
jgi:Transglutaminase-like superfamily